MARNLFSVADRIVIVTGGLGQLGRQFSLALADAGAEVAVFDVRVDERRVAKAFGARRTDKRLMFVPVDVTRRRSIEAGLKQVVSRWGIPSGLINNAAIDAPPHTSTSDHGPFESYPERAWDEVMDVNVKGVFLCCQVIGGRMAAVRHGSIVNICSTYGLVSPDQRVYEYRHRRGGSFFKPAAYSASKSSLLNLTRYLATYWADRTVRVNTLTLGGVYNGQDKEFLKRYTARVPLGRMAREDDYNGAVLFLVSDASAYMTGSNLVVDGGWTAW